MYRMVARFRDHRYSETSPIVFQCSLWDTGPEMTLCQNPTQTSSRDPCIQWHHAWRDNAGDYLLKVREGIGFLQGIICPNTARVDLAQPDAVGIGQDIVLNFSIEAVHEACVLLSSL